MTKKKHAKMTLTSQLQENIVVEEEKPSSIRKRPRSEIDEIFAGKKRKKSKQEKTEKPDEDVTKRPDETKNKKNKKKIKGPNDGEFVDPPARTKKRTEDGLAIYTEEELGFNKADAGGTPLCPFDCSCCF